jgi:hypothetical protein
MKDYLLYLSGVISEAAYHDKTAEKRRKVWN